MADRSLHAPSSRGPADGGRERSGVAPSCPPFVRTSRIAGRIVTALALFLALPPLAACGGDDPERAAAREELERQFGRRDTAGGTPGAAFDTPAGATDREAATPGSGQGGGDAPAAGGETAGGDTPAGDTAGTEEPGAPGETAPEEEARGEEAAATDTASTGADRDDRPAPPSPGTAVDPDRWLAMADSAYRRLPSLRARFEQVVEVPLLDRTNRGVGIWYQRGRDRFRMDFTDPPDDLFVADGTYLWLYQPSQQPDQVIKAELAGGAAQAGTADVLGRILAEARTAYDAAYEGTETVSGHETHAVALTPRGPSEYRRVRVWIAAADWLVRRFRIEQENEMVRTVTLAALEPGVTLADSLFRFVVPEGVDVYEP